MTDLKNIPKLPGVYLMRDSRGDIVYIGKAKNLRNRIKSYFTNGFKEFRPIASMFFSIKEIDYIICGNEQEALFLEQRLITNLKPKYNIFWKDDKSYPFLEITYSDKFPKISFYRSAKLEFNKNNKYFGPYPNSKSLKFLIKWVAKFFHIRQCDFNSDIFPFRNDLEKSKYESCIYYQTNQCLAPCLGKISEKNYRISIDNLILFLRGKWKKLVTILKKQMMSLSRKKDFEKAIILRDIIKYIENVQNRVVTKQIDEKSLVFNTISKVDLLKKIQTKFNLKFLPVIIEAVDISTFSGTNNVGSVVRFVNGLPEKKSYRRYKIKTVFEQNDFGMLKEVVFRRYFRLLSEKEQLPQLLLVDGGKGQLNAVIEIIQKLDILNKIDVISLSKSDNDEVYLVGATSPIKLGNLEEDNLLRYIRDEAHRFAVSYNRKLASKTLFKD